MKCVFLFVSIVVVVNCLDFDDVPSPKIALLDDKVEVATPASQSINVDKVEVATPASQSSNVEVTVAQPIQPTRPAIQTPLQAPTTTSTTSPTPSTTLPSPATTLRTPSEDTVMCGEIRISPSLYRLVDQAVRERLVDFEKRIASLLDEKHEVRGEIESFANNLNADLDFDKPKNK
jgi:hypothetical protein